MGDCFFLVNAKAPNKQDGQVSELITKAEIAKRLSASQRSIDNWEKKGLIRKIKVGRLSRYDWAEVVQKLKANQD
jgi:hypothetical protein